MKLEDETLPEEELFGKDVSVVAISTCSSQFEGILDIQEEQVVTDQLSLSSESGSFDMYWESDTDIFVDDLMCDCFPTRSVVVAERRSVAVLKKRITAKRRVAVRQNIPLDVTSSQLNLVADKGLLLEDELGTTLDANSPFRVTVFSCFIGRFPFVREVAHQDFSDLESDLQELSL